MATTTWPEVLGAIGALLAIVAACWLVARHLNRRCDERVDQQTREARELHDTLLQNFQGELLKFHAAALLLPQRATEARTLLEEALSQADQTMAEARDAVQAMGSAGTSVWPDGESAATSLRSQGRSRE